MLFANRKDVGPYNSIYDYLSSVELHKDKTPKDSLWLLLQLYEYEEYGKENE